MITLYTFGPSFGLPDPSPFVSKAEILLKMAGIEYTTRTGGMRQAPKGKLPFIEDDGERIADSTFIRFHLEKKYGADFNIGLSSAESAIAWAFEKMCEDHLYWAILHDRWMLDENFDKGPRTFFDFAPWALRPLIVAMVRREVKRNLWGHGLGRHTQAEIALLAARDLEAIAGFLGDKPWLMGEKPCGADATVWSFVAGALCPLFQGAIYANAQSHSNLVTYAERGTERWFPALAACR